MDCEQPYAVQEMTTKAMHGCGRPARATPRKREGELRILHVLNHVREVGNGMVNVAVDLACLQSKAGHAVAVASSGGEYEQLLRRYGVRHYMLAQERRPVALAKAGSTFRRIASDFGPQLVHTHMKVGTLLAWLVRPLHSYALVTSVHNEFQRGSIVMGLGDGVIAVSGAVARSMARRGVSGKKLRVVLNGTLESPRTRALADYRPLPLARPAIVTVAGMYRRKGIPLLLDAFSAIASDFPEAHLYLIGEGPDRPLFEAQARNTPVAERIHFEGFQPEPQRYLLASDIFVLASHREPCALVLFEAREAGLAIVATAVDGTPEALDDGRAGLLVPRGDDRALASVLRRLLRDPSELEAWKRRARENLEGQTATRVAHDVLAVYSEVARARIDHAVS